MILFYNISIKLYYFTIKIVSPFNEKAKQWLLGRRNIFEELQSSINKNDKIAWFHTASLGEFEQGRPVIEGFREKYPDYKILLTFFSPSGYEIQKKYNKADYVFYLPIDSKKNAKKFIEIINPRVAFFVKYEFWYHYLKQLSKNNIPTYIFSAIFRDNQLFFKWYGAWYRNMLKYFTKIYVQDNNSKELLIKININNVEIGGDTRFDRVYSLSKNVKPIKIVEDFVKNSFVIIAGSTWLKDEEIIAEYIKSSSNDIKWIIAPHEVHTSHINKILKIINHPILKFSEANIDNIKNSNILLIDSIGLLSSLYQYGDIAYIGGGFGVGIHNTLEAATFGIPVVFGPNNKRFKEAQDLIRISSGYSIKDYNTFKSVLNKLISDENLKNKSGESAKKYVENMSGGTTKILSQLPVL